jgi:carbonic anhydrase
MSFRKLAFLSVFLVVACDQSVTDVPNDEAIAWPVDNFGAVTGQSPVDIPSSATLKFRSGDPVFDYPSAVDLTSVANTGEELKATVGGNAGIVIGGKRYQLQQFHFHRASEHTVDGAPGAMEVHLVHIAADGAIAVIGVLFRTGAANTAIDVLWNAVPETPRTSRAPAGSFDLRGLLPPTTSPYYTYSGSLTTAPFSDRLTWIVFKPTLMMSAAQVSRYAAVFEEPNVRALQALRGRAVYERIGIKP